MALEQVDAPPNKDQLAVLVFKDNRSARTFRVPLSWISRLGVLLGLCLAATLVSSFFAARYYYTAKTASPAKVRDLEKELDDLKNQNLTLENKLAEAKANAPMPAPTSAETGIPSQVPQSTETAGPAALSAPIKPSLFGALPPSTSATALPDKATLPFSLTEPTNSWRGNTLHVHFAIQYTKGDGGNQQGRIILLARGNSRLLAYPDGALNLSGADSLIQPERGEYFSVSRFREVNAEFGPVTHHDDLKDIEVLIFNATGQLIMAEKLATPPQAPARKTTGPKADAPQEAEQP